MKTLMKNDLQVQKQIKGKRRILNNAARSENNLQESDVVEFRLTQQDYQDIIDIKETRASKSRSRSTMFFYMGLAIALLFANIIFGWKFADNQVVDDLSLLQNVQFDEMLEVPNTEQPPPPPPKVLQPTTIVEVPDDEVLEKVNIELDVEVTEDMSIEQVVFEVTEIEEEKAEEIFDIVENRPEPEGGIKAFYQYVAENIKYPERARRMDISGRVFVKFVVDKEGFVKSVQAVKGIGGGCDEEAVRIIENSPRWIPGKQRGKPVNVYMMLPITFQLKN